MNISIRKFTQDDISYKVLWINDPQNNRYLHYDLPLEYEKTKNWFDRIKDSNNRYDAIIEVDDKPVGLNGLLSIDFTNRKAEYYVCLGELSYRGQGIAEMASKILLNIAFYDLKLNRVYLYTEENNLAAQKLFERIGFQKEGVLKEDVLSHGTFVNRYVMALTLADYKRLRSEKCD